MKTSLLLSVCLSLLVSSAVAASPATASSGSDEFSPPAPLSAPAIRSVAGFPGYENATIKLKLVVDEKGVPQQVDALGLIPVETKELLVRAVKQWKFRPATRNGVPVSARVILPLQLAVSGT
jgi:periplasmic protein TonB